MLVLISVGGADATVRVSLHGRHVSVYLLAALTAVALALAVSQLRLPRAAVAPLVVSSGLLLAWAARAVVAGSSSKYTIQNALVYCLAIAAAVTAVRAGAARAPAWMLEAAIVAGVVVADGLALAGLLAVGHVTYIVSPRPWALLGPLGVAAAMTLARRRVLLGAAAVAAQTALVAVSGSRIAFVGCLVVVCASLIGRSRRAVVAAAGSLLAGVAVFLAAVWFVKPFHDRFFIPPGVNHDNGVTIAGHTLDTQGRMIYWREDWHYFLQRPVFGHGLGAASRHMLERFPPLDHPTNEYLRVLVDAGLVGAAGFVLVLVWLTVGTWRRRLRLDRADYREPGGRLVAVAANWLPAFLLSLVTDNSLVYFWVLLPFAAVVGYAMGRPARLAGPAPYDKPVVSDTDEQTARTSRSADVRRG